MLKLGTKIKVIQNSDPDCPIDEKYLGQTGTVTKEGSGERIGDMIQVTFGDGSTDAFWTEELRAV